MIKSKRFKNLLAVIISLAVIFAVVNAIWLIHLTACYIMPVKNNTDLEKTGNNSSITYQTSVNYNDSDSIYDIAVFYPKYLKYSGNYGVSQRLVLDAQGTTYINKYHVVVAIKPHVFGEMSYQFQVTDFTDGDKKYNFVLDEELSVKSYNGLPPDTLLKNEEVFSIITDEINIAQNYFK
jgi:hypothetical protein